MLAEVTDVLKSRPFFQKKKHQHICVTKGYGSHVILPNLSKQLIISIFGTGRNYLFCKSFIYISYEDYEAIKVIFSKLSSTPYGIIFFTNGTERDFSLSEAGRFNIIRCNNHVEQRAV